MLQQHVKYGIIDCTVTGLCPGLYIWYNHFHLSITLFVKVNILLAAAFLTKTVFFNSRGVSRYILTILMVNMFLYVSYYITCKLHWR